VQAAGVPHLGVVGSSGAGTGAAGSAATWWASHSVGGRRHNRSVGRQERAMTVGSAAPA